MLQFSILLEGIGFTFFNKILIFSGFQVKIPPKRWFIVKLFVKLLRLLTRTSTQLDTYVSLVHTYVCPTNTVVRYIFSQIVSKIVSRRWFLFKNCPLFVKSGVKTLTSFKKEAKLSFLSSAPSAPLLGVCPRFARSIHLLRKGGAKTRSLLGFASQLLLSSKGPKAPPGLRFARPCIIRGVASPRH